jgi:hypothetical protein
MASLLRRLSQSSVTTAVLTLLFFSLFYLYLLIVVDLRLIYHGGGSVLNFPVFYTGWEFFHQTVYWPGGLVAYISGFFAQFFYIGWAGALVATAQAGLLWLCTGVIVKTASGRQIRWISFVTPIFLLILYGGYVYPLGMAMWVLAALFFACVYLKIAVKSRQAALPLFLVLSVILYLIAGGGYLLFALVCGIYELFLRRRAILGAIILLSAPIIAYILTALIFKASVIDVLNDFIPRDIINITRVAAACGLYMLLPLTLVGLWLSETLKKGVFDRFTAWFAKKEIIAPAPLVAIVAAVIVGFFGHNSWLKTQISVTWYSYNGMWRQILETSMRYPGDVLINHAADRALYHTGWLTQDMFAYGQRPEAMMLPKEASNLLGMWRLFDTYIDLGYMNLADSALSRCVEMYGEQPIYLKRLALVNMVKGDIGSARVYLGALSRTLFDAGWARAYLEKIDNDPNLSADEEVQRLRGMMPAINRNLRSINEDFFLDLLDKNRHNRMAFEYLMSFYLLNNQLDKFVENLSRLNDFDYVGIPRVYEQAILLYGFTKKKKVETPGREISVESHEQFDNFLKTLFSRYGGDKKAAFYELARDYGDTYYFYSAYGQSGIQQ